MEREWIAPIATLMGVALTGLIAFGLKWLEMGRQRDEERRKNLRNKLETLHSLILDYPGVLALAAADAMKFQVTTDSADEYRHEIVRIMVTPAEPISTIHALQRLYAPELTDAWFPIASAASRFPDALKDEIFRDKSQLPPDGPEITKELNIIHGLCFEFAAQLEDKILKV